MSWTPRLCTIDDWEKLLDFSRKTFFDTYFIDSIRSDLQIYIDATFTPHGMKQELSDKHSSFYVIENKEYIIAYMKLVCVPCSSAELSTVSLELQRLYVDRQFQGKGLGKSLLLFAIQKGKEINASSIWLNVWEHNTSAIEFYKQFHFTLVGESNFQLGRICRKGLLMRIEDFSSGS